MEAETKNLIDVVSRRNRIYSTLLKALQNSEKNHSDDPAIIVDALKKTLRSHDDDDAEELMQLLVEKFDRNATKFALELQSTVSEICDRNSWSVEGHWPLVYVERAVELKYDQQRRRIMLAGSKINNLSADTIEKSIRESVVSLLPRNFSLSDFRRQLLEAYRHASTTDSSAVSILSVYRSLVVSVQTPAFWKNADKDRFTSVTIEQFRAQLTALLNNPSLFPFEGLQLRLYPPLKPEDGLYMYLPAESRFAFVGRLEFSSANG
jgi:hypothetical protein